MNYFDEVLESAMDVLNEFYKDTAVMLENLKGLIINERKYKDISGDRVCWEVSSSISHPEYWNPVYLSLWFQSGDDDEEFISITIILKEYWGNQVPKKEYSIYGCKFHKVIDHLKKYNWLGIYSIENPSEDYKRIEKEDFVEVINPEHFGSCKIIKRSLWDMKDKQNVSDFVEQVTSL